LSYGRVAVCSLPFPRDRVNATCALRRLLSELRSHLEDQLTALYYVVMRDFNLIVWPAVERDALHVLILF